jgi:molybdenum cofactor cytidylyltransferase
MNCAIVLAAGMSTRMGAHKVLLPLGATTVIAHVVDALARSAIDRTFVVVGHEGARVAEALAGHAATIVANPDYAAGMLSSVRAGLRALPGECGAALIALGDQPRIDAALVDAMLRAFAASGKGIVVPVFGGARGHPLLCSTRYRDEILAAYDEVGLRGLLGAHADDVLELRAADAAVLADLDTPDDYARERARVTRGKPRVAPP